MDAFSFRAGEWTGRGKRVVRANCGEHEQEMTRGDRNAERW